MKYECLGLGNFCHRMVRKKLLRTASTMETPMKRCLNIWHLLFYCVASIIGSGLYVLTGTLIRDHSGPATAITYLLAAISAIFTALCYAELGTLFPKAGSVYLYTYMTFGEVGAYLTGWALIMLLITSTSAVARAFSDTINILTNNTIVSWTEENLASFGTSNMVSRTPDLIAAGFLILLILITVTGANFSMTINAIFVSLQIICLLIMSVAFFVLGDKANYKQEGGFLPFGGQGLLQGGGLAIFGLSGFDNLGNAAEEAINPQRDIPIALLGGITICTLLYMSTSFGLAYMIPRTAISYTAPFVAAFDHVGQPVLLGIAAFSTILATGATKLVVMYTVPRMIYSVAEDGLIFKFLSIVDKRTRIPLYALFVGGGIAVALAAFIQTDMLAEISTIYIVLCYIFVSLDVMLIRYTPNPELRAVSKISASAPAAVEEDTNDSHECPMRLNLPRFMNWMHRSATFKSILAVFNVLIVILGVIVNKVLHTSNPYRWIGFGVCLFLLLVFFGLLCLYAPRRYGDCFQIPLMPLIPCLSLLTNGILLMSMTNVAWVQFGIWTSIGLVIYFAYGMWYSEVEEEKFGEVTPVKTEICDGLEMT